jgi:hypothetical protein
MNWQQFLPVFAVAAIVVFFVWRSSGSKKSGCGAHCRHTHHQTPPEKKESSSAQI